MWTPHAGSGGGACAAVLLREYTGDDTNNRLIELDDWYEVVEIRQVSGNCENSDTHLVMAGCIQHRYWARWWNQGDLKSYHAGEADADTVFQGRNGPWDTRIQLGSGGALTYGTNQTGVVYLITAYKFPVRITPYTPWP